MRIAHFSREFYDKLGHETADELVSWANLFYEEKREIDQLRWRLDEVLAEVRDLKLLVIKRCGTAV